jgi:agmatine deiminase
MNGSPRPKRTPAELGYRWPAEWAPHAATWLAWPHCRDTWPGNFERIPPLFAKLAKVLSEREPVHVLAGGDRVFADAQRHVGGLENVHLHEVETDDAWIRDHGPTFLTGSAGAPPAFVDWRYNAWGGKYPPFDKDNAVPKRIAEILGRRRFVSDMVLEGGAIDGNGCGTALAAEACLLDSRRNPGFSRESVERRLAEYCGVRNVLWLRGGGIAGDDTDGHVDQLARFVNPTTVVAALEDDPRDENYQLLRENFERLRTFTDQDGKPLQVIPLPMPRAVCHSQQRLPASYCNFYIASGAVITPKYDDPADEQAAAALAGLFPDRHVVLLPARDLVLGLGGFHCLTQQEPVADAGGK